MAKALGGYWSPSPASSVLPTAAHQQGDVMTLLKCVLVRSLLAALVAAAQTPMPDGSEEADKQELKKLEGVWLVKEHTISSKETPKDRLKTAPWAEITITGDALKMSGVDFKIVIDPFKKPKTIDRLHKAADGKEIERRASMNWTETRSRCAIPLP